MVSKGLAGAATLAMALASAGAFAPGKAFVRNPLSPASHGIDRVVKVDGAVSQSVKVSGHDTTNWVGYQVLLLCLTGNLMRPETMV